MTQILLGIIAELLVLIYIEILAFERVIMEVDEILNPEFTGDEE